MIFLSIALFFHISANLSLKVALRVRSLDFSNLNTLCYVLYFFKASSKDGKMFANMFVCGFEQILSSELIST